MGELWRGRGGNQINVLGKLRKELLYICKSWLQGEGDGKKMEMVLVA